MWHHRHDKGVLIAKQIYFIKMGCRNSSLSPKVAHNEVQREHVSECRCRFCKCQKLGRSGHDFMIDVVLHDFSNEKGRFVRGAWSVCGAHTCDVILTSRSRRTKMLTGGSVRYED